MQIIYVSMHLGTSFHIRTTTNLPLFAVCTVVSDIQSILLVCALWAAGVHIFVSVLISVKYRQLCKQAMIFISIRPIFTAVKKF